MCAGVNRPFHPTIRRVYLLQLPIVPSVKRKLPLTTSSSSSSRGVVRQNDYYVKNVLYQTSYYSERGVRRKRAAPRYEYNIAKYSPRLCGISVGVSYGKSHRVPPYIRYRERVQLVVTTLEKLKKRHHASRATTGVVTCDVKMNKSTGHGGKGRSVAFSSS